MPLIQHARKNVRATRRGPGRFERAARESGVSLVEVMVSVVVLAVVVIGAVAFFAAGRRTVEFAARQRTATQIGQERLERARALGYAGVADDNGSVTVEDVRYTWTLTATPVLADPADSGSVYKTLEVSVDWPASDNHPVVVRSAMSP